MRLRKKQRFARSLINCIAASIGIGQRTELRLSRTAGSQRRDFCVIAGNNTTKRSCSMSLAWARRPSRFRRRVIARAHRGISGRKSTATSIYTPARSLLISSLIFGLICARFRMNSCANTISITSRIAAAPLMCSKNTLGAIPKNGKATAKSVGGSPRVKVPAQRFCGLKVRSESFSTM